MVDVSCIGSPLTGSRVVDAAGLLSTLIAGCRSVTDAVAKVGLKQGRWHKLLCGNYFRSDGCGFVAVSPSDGCGAVAVLSADGWRIVTEML